jgi:hypothetical protein
LGDVNWPTKTIIWQAPPLPATIFEKTMKAYWMAERQETLPAMQVARV